MLDDRAGHGVAQAHALQLVFLDYAAKRGGEHVLVTDGGICAVRAGEGDAEATDDGNPSDLGTYEHWSLPARRGGRMPRRVR